MKIIQATLDQVELIVPLFDLYRQFYKQPSDVVGARRFLSERLHKQQSVIFLATDDTGAAGTGFTQLYPAFSSDAMKRLWILNDLYVVSTERKSGVGRALMDRVRQFAIETGADRLILETAVDNFSAQRLYEKLGYVRDDLFFRYSLIL